MYSISNICSEWHIKQCTETRNKKTICYIWPHMFLLLITGITCKQLSLNLTQYVIITKEQKQSYVFQENVTLSCKPGFTGTCKSISASTMLFLKYIDVLVLTLDLHFCSVLVLWLGFFHMYWVCLFLVGISN